MSRSRKKPVFGDFFRHWIACVDDISPKKWKQTYHRVMRRGNKQTVKLLEKLEADDVDEDDSEYMDKPAKTSIGNEYNSPGDGKTLFKNDGSYRKKHWWTMK